MGNSLSSWGGRKRVQGIINSAGLPLQIDEQGPAEDHKGELSPFTEAYDAKGWFTGVRSKVSIPKTPESVYNSLSKDLHKVFTPITECDDEIEEEDEKEGSQVIFRVVRIPFKVAFVTGNLKLRLHVEQSTKTGQIHFESVKEGRLITRFVADFQITPKEGAEEHTEVKLDAKINAQSLPPPPFKGMVKEVMVRKMDACMVDLVNFHAQSEEKRVLADGRAASTPLARKGSQTGFLATLRRSLGRRPSLEKQQAAMDRAASTAPSTRKSGEWRKSFEKLTVGGTSRRRKPSKQLEELNAARPMYNAAAATNLITDGQPNAAPHMGGTKLPEPTAAAGSLPPGGQAGVFSQWQQEAQAIPESAFKAASQLEAL